MASDKKPGGSGTFVMLLSFLLVGFILFDPTLRAILSKAIGAVFNPIVGFRGEHPLWTVGLAGVVMILASSIIRHFLVDWVKMARVQEVMRHFQKEFREAQKANNTYRMKRLTEAQPEIMKLQADMSGEQLKPMAFTMIVVVPIFLWLSAFMAEPVEYEVTVEDGSAGALLVAHGDNLWDAAVVRPDEADRMQLMMNARLHAYALEPGASGTAALDGKTGRVEVPLAGAPALPEGGVVVNLTAGDHVVRTFDNLDMWNPEEPAKLDRALVLLLDADGRVARVVVAEPGEKTFTLDEPAQARILAMAPPNANPRGSGNFQVQVDGERVAEFQGRDVVLFEDLEGDAVVVPKVIEVPWNERWDLNVSWWILPRWIILYTLISIPIGTVVQRLLKMWEFKRVDLDRDGIPAGKSG